METTIEPTSILYKGKQVNACLVTVRSVLPIQIDRAWELLGTSTLLEFICRGMVAFRPIGGAFPKVWKEGARIETRTRLFGFIPFGGMHVLHFERIDGERFVLQTREYDRAAKVWDHRISMVAINGKSTQYEDAITIYGAWLTRLIAAWAAMFYRHRQRRWQIVATSGEVPQRGSLN